MFGLPDLVEDQDYQITSGATDLYSCLAHAIHRYDRVIWPDEDETCAWPEQLERKETLAVFREFFRLCGYRDCVDGRLQLGTEKIVLYKDQIGLVVHVARQLKNGHWSSKLGSLADIEHISDRTIESAAYGDVAHYMWRPRSNMPPAVPDLHPPQQRPPLIV